jgi:gamma-glutamylputrescine oxidase
MTKLNRRSFLKSAALTGAGAAVGVQALDQLSPRIWPEETVFEPNHSYWAKSAASVNSALAENMDVDVAIIGGGFTGLSSAYYIRKNSPAKQVVVLEAVSCGNGASGRNGAMVLNMTADRYMNFSSDPAMDKRIYDLTSANIRTLSALAAEVQVDCELDVNGSLQVLNTASDVADSKRYVERARTLGIPVEYWDKEQTAAAIGTRCTKARFTTQTAARCTP